MENVELTEDQFTLLKMFCMNHSLAVVCLHPLDTDEPKVREQFVKNQGNMQALLKAGLVKDMNEMCKEGLAFAKANGQRSFDTYGITEEAYKMFSAPEGMVC